MEKKLKHSRYLDALIHGTQSTTVNALEIYVGAVNTRPDTHERFMKFFQLTVKEGICHRFHSVGGVLARTLWDQCFSLYFDTTPEVSGRSSGLSRRTSASSRSGRDSGLASVLKKKMVIMHFITCRSRRATCSSGPHASWLLPMWQQETNANDAYLIKKRKKPAQLALGCPAPPSAKSLHALSAEVDSFGERMDLVLLSLATARLVQSKPENPGSILWDYFIRDADTGAVSAIWFESRQ
jgi:hypothetical protein